MTGYLTLLGPTTAATVYTTAKATITITIAKAKSFSMVSLFFSLRTRVHFGYVFAKKVPAHVHPASWGPDGDSGVGAMVCHLPQSKQIRQFSSARIAL